MGTDIKPIIDAAYSLASLFGVGGLALTVIASYLGKFWWDWQVENALEGKDKIIAERDERIASLTAEIKECQKREESSNDRYRVIAMGALEAAKESASVGRQVVAAARSRTR